LGLQTSLVTMAEEGQIKKDVIKKARNTREVGDQMAKEKENEAQQAATDPAKLEKAAQDLASFRSGLGVFTEEGTPQPRKDTALDEAYRRVEDRKKRRGIASGLKDLSKRGALTGDLLKEARQRATAAGVSEEQFSSFIGKEGIKTQDFATAAPTESKEEAAQNVMFQRQYGTGLGTLAAMQDPNYELGSGSALRQPARSIGPASGKFRRAARRLRRQGYGAAAQQMAAAGELAHMSKSSIDTQALRGQRMLQKRAAGREASKQDKLAAGSKDIFDVVGVDKPADRPNIEEKSKTPYISPLDRTLNKGPFGAIKRQGQRI
jgi:hypothetical protein